MSNYMRASNAATYQAAQLRIHHSPIKRPDTPVHLGCFAVRASLHDELGTGGCGRRFRRETEGGVEDAEEGDGGEASAPGLRGGAGVAGSSDDGRAGVGARGGDTQGRGGGRREG